MSAEIIQLPTPSTDELILVDPGNYTAVYAGHLGMFVFRGAKLKVMFRLSDRPNLVLPRWYRVTTYKGRVSAPVHSDLVREISAALNQRVRHDRIPVALLEDIPVRVLVRTVEKDREQHQINPVNAYSVVSKLEGRA